jgi:MarR family transcriptional repressor of emrRAB
MNKGAIFTLIERIASLIRAEERKKCSALNLQYTHIQTLNYLSRCNKYSDTPAAVANYLGMTRGTVSQTLLLLERRGYIKKVPDAQDRRVIHMELLPSGWKTLQQAQLVDLFDQAAKHLKQNGQDDYEAVLTRILTGLQKANQSHTFGLCKTCQYFNSTQGSFFCGLTKEPLTPNDSEKICQEHKVA